VQVGREVTWMGKLPQSPRYKKVIEYAIEEAKSLGNNYVGTEHLLLGLLRVEEGVAVQVLRSLGVDTASVKESMNGLLSKEIESQPMEFVCLTTYNQFLPGTSEHIVTYAPTTVLGRWQVQTSWTTILHTKGVR